MSRSDFSCVSCVWSPVSETRMLATNCSSLLSHFLFNFTWCWAWSREVLINHEILSQCKVIQHGTPFFLQWESARNKINDSSEHSSSANNNAWWWSLGLVLQGVKIIIIRAHINKVTIMTLTDNDDTDDGQVTIHKKWSSGHDASHSTVLTPPQHSIVMIQLPNIVCIQSLSSHQHNHSNQLKFY